MLHRLLAAEKECCNRLPFREPSRHLLTRAMPKAKAVKAKPNVSRTSVSRAKAKAPPKKSAARQSVAKLQRGGPGAAKTLAARPGKWVYAFGDGHAEGRANMRDTLGG